jgi:hypothetical protein
MQDIEPSELRLLLRAGEGRHSLNGGAKGSDVETVLDQRPSSDRRSVVLIPFRANARVTEFGITTGESYGFAQRTG